MNTRIVLERKKMDVKPTALVLGSGKTYSPSFSSEDITYMNVASEDVDELLKLAGKEYGVSKANVSKEGATEDGREVSI
ncbi:hypothetical protein IT087_00870 [Candidatus Uhrbacteria bacterium]|nr:hypothetical protein [Candidatus Uhrbacteria bacterium]